MTRIRANGAIDSFNPFFRAFQQLEKVAAVKEQNAGHVGLAIFVIRCIHHLFQHGDRNVVADMAAINYGCEHHASCE